MSSLRNTIQRRAHRERAQPLERQRLGLLEKKKDYQKRAKDYGKKKTVLKSLRAKAAERNEDEFYFGMMSRSGPGSSLTVGARRFTGAVEGDRGNRPMDVDTVRLFKTQDLGYLRTMRNVAAKEARELEERFILAGGADVYDQDEDEDDDDEDESNIAMAGSKKPKKIVFFDAAEERNRALKERQAKDDQDDPMWEDEDDNDDDGSEADDKGKKRPQKTTEAIRKAQTLEKLHKKLQHARKKLKALSNAEFQLELQQAKMAKTATSGGITKSGHRIKVRERKR